MSGEKRVFLICFDEGFLSTAGFIKVNYVEDCKPLSKFNLNLNDKNA